MSKGFSVYLNFLRAAAAITVLLSHVSEDPIGGSFFWRFRQFHTGDDAVVVFFVLSGLVVAFAAERTPSLFNYGTARLSRLWSVVVPVVLAAPLLWLVGSTINPGFYDLVSTKWGTGGISGVAGTLTFTDQIWFQNTTFFADLPLWSLGYEAIYYALFGIAFYLGGWLRLTLFICVSLVAGPKVLLLMPLWLLGAAMYKWRSKLAVSNEAAWACMATSVAAYAAFLLVRNRFDEDVLIVLRWIGIAPWPTLGFSMRFGSDYLVATLVALHLVGAQRLATDGLDPSGRIARLINWFADRSFAIYGIHFPLLLFASALVGNWRSTPSGALLMTAFALGMSLLFAEISDLRKAEWQRLVRSMARGGVSLVGWSRSNA